jgi:hypothetical protein
MGYGCFVVDGWFAFLFGIGRITLFMMIMKMLWHLCEMWRF